MADAALPPLVAIATPVYNGASFLEEAIECVQAQTYPNLVHCVLDNASSDATPQIIDRFKSRRVPLIAIRNDRTLPVTQNWNAALALVPSDAGYFRILAADDWIDPSYVTKMVALGEHNPDVGVIACQERLGTLLVGADLLPDQAVLDGRTVVRQSLLQKVKFPYDHCLYRYPRTGIPKDFFDTEYYGTNLLCADVDAAMRMITNQGCAIVHEPLAMTRWPGTVTETEMIPNQIGIWSSLQLIDRWGPLVFDTESEYLSCRNRHLRYYYLHLLLWRAQRKFKLLEQHQRWLRNASAPPTLWAYAHAVVEWPLQRFAQRLRQLGGRLGFPISVSQID